MKLALELVRQARRPVPMRSRGSTTTGGRMRGMEQPVEEWAEAGEPIPIGEPPVSRDAGGAAPIEQGRRATASIGEVDARALGAGHRVGAWERRAVAAVSASSVPMTSALPGPIVGSGHAPMSEGSTAAAVSPRAMEMACLHADGATVGVELAADANEVTSTLVGTPTVGAALATDANEVSSRLVGAPMVSAELAADANEVTSRLTSATTVASRLDRAKEVAPKPGPDAPPETLQPHGASPVAPALAGARAPVPRQAAPTFAAPPGSNEPGRVETELGVLHPVTPGFADSGLAWLVARSFPVAEVSSNEPARRSPGSRSLRERTSNDPALGGRVGEPAHARGTDDAPLRARSIEASSSPALDREPMARSSSASTLERTAVPSTRASMPAGSRLEGVVPERDPSHATTRPQPASVEAVPRAAAPASRVIAPDGVPAARARRTASAAEPHPVVRIGTIEVFMEPEAPRDAIAQTLRRPDPPPWSSDLGRRFLRRF